MRSRLAEFFRGLPKGFLGNVGWQYISTIWTLVLGFVYSAAVGRALGLERYGLLSINVAFATLVFQFVELRLHEAVIKYFAEFQESGEEAKMIALVKLSLLCDFVSGALALGLALGLGPLIVPHVGSLALLLAALGVFSSTVGAATSRGLLRIFGDFKSQAIAQVVSTTARFAITLGGLYFANFGVIEVLAVNLAAAGVANIFLIAWSIRALRKKIALPWSRAPMSELKPVIGPMARFTASTYGLSIAQIPTKDLDVNLLGMMTSLEVVGAYRLAKTFMSAVWSLADPIFLAIYPEIAKLWARRDFPALRSFLKRSSLLFGAGGISMVGGAWLVVPIVIDLAMGPEFHESSGLFRWMVWGACLWMPFVWVNPLMLAAGRPDLTLWSAVIAAVVSLVLNLVAISFFAGQGAAIVYGFNTPLVVFIALVLARASGIWRELGSAQPKAG